MIKTNWGQVMNKGGFFLLKPIWRFVFLIGISGLLLAGCQEEQELGTGTVIGNEKKVVLAEETNLLILSEDEERLYGNFKEQKDIQLLKDIDPIMIAKFFVKALQEKDYHTEYLLYIDDPEQVQWDLETHLSQMISEEEQLAKQLQKNFQNISQVKFIEENEMSGYLEFPLEGENVGRFQMLKNKDGIWKVKFRPLQ